MAGTAEKMGCAARPNCHVPDDGVILAPGDDEDSGVSAPGAPHLRGTPLLRSVALIGLVGLVGVVGSAVSDLRWRPRAMTRTVKSSSWAARWQQELVL